MTCIVVTHAQKTAPEEGHGQCTVQTQGGDGLAGFASTVGVDLITLIIPSAASRNDVWMKGLLTL